MIKKQFAEFFRHFFSLFKQGSFWFTLLVIGGCLGLDFWNGYLTPGFLFWGIISCAGASLFVQIFGVTKWFQSLFGKLSWDGPTWLASGDESFLKKYWKKSRANPKVSISVLVSLLAIVFMSIWWINRPQPKQPPIATIDLSKPSLTYHVKKNSGELQKVISTLSLHFSESVAPLKDINKTIKQGIALEPKIAGEWSWSSDSSLLFKPSQDWLPGEVYTVELEKELTSGKYTIKEDELEFKIPKIEMESQQGEFYDDPRNPKIRKAIFTLNFNYPITEESLRKRIKLAEVEYQKNKISKTRTIGHKVIFGDRGYKVYIHSEQVQIPKEEGAIELYIDKGIVNQFGGPKSDFEIKQNVRVPGLFNYFYVADSDLKIIDDEKGVSEHIGILSFSTGVAASQFKNALKVYELPHKDKRNQVINWRSKNVRVEDLILEGLPLVDFELLPSSETYPKTHMFKIQPKVKRYYLITIQEGLKSGAEFSLPRTVKQVVYANPFPQKLRLLHKGSILSLKGEKKLSLYSLNVEKIEVSIGQLLNEQVQHLMTQTYGNYTNPDFRNNYEFSEKNLAHFDHFEVDVYDSSSVKPSYSTIDLQKYLDRKVNGKKTRGVFFIEVKGKDTYKSDKRLIVISDLGVMVKKDIYGNHDIFVQSLHNGEPVSGAKIEFISENGLPLITDKTNSDGHVLIPKIEREDKFAPYPKAILVKKGTDLAYLKYSDYNLLLSYSRFAIGGKSNARGEDALSAFLFSDRGIYRPGEDVQIGLIAKAGKWSQDLSGIPVDIIVENSRGKTILKDSRSLRKNGLDDFSFTLNRNAPTGSYTAKLYNFFDNNRKKTRRLIGSVDIKVEEFLPDRLKIQTDLSKKKSQGWVTPEDINGQVVLKNLFGYPAEGHRIRGKMKIEPTSLSFSKHAGFRFDNPTRDLEAFSEDLSELKTDKNGEVQYPLDLDRFAKKIFKLQFMAEGFEKEGGRSVAAQVSTLVSPYPYLLGLKSEGDYSYIKREDKRKIQLIAVDKDLKILSPTDLDYELIELKYINVLTKRPNGSYAYESVLKEEIVLKEALRLDREITDFVLKTDKAGDFKFKIKNQEGIILSEFRYSVAGQRDLARSLNKHGELQVKLNKQDFEQGEKIEMEIKSPYIGFGLITIEKDKVYKHQWFKQDKKTTIQKISLPRDLEGNAYVNITLLRDISSKEIYSQPLSYGVFPFTISKESRRENLTLDVQTVAKPGEPLTINFKSSGNSEVILYAINEGILQFAKYKNPMPLDYFFTKKSLEVQTYQILNYLLPENSLARKLLAPGGGLGGISQQLNPFNRKLKKPVAFWSGVKKASPKGSSWKIDIPGHFNGSLRIIAVGVGKRTLGTEISKMFVRADIILTPNVLTFASPGDRFQVPLTALNNIEESGSQVPIELSLGTGPQLKVEGASTVSVNIDERKDKTHTFSLTAGSKLGSAQLDFLGVSGDISNSIEETISLRPSAPFLTSLKIGNISNSKETLMIERVLYREFAQREITIGATPFAYASSLEKFLAKNEFGCTEQILSRAVPHIILGKRAYDGYSQTKASQYISQTLNHIRARQNDSGEVLTYPEYYTSRPFINLYTLHFLVLAKEAGYNIDLYMMRKTASYIKNNFDSLNNLVDKSYAIYLLTRIEEVTTPYLLRIETELQRLYDQALKGEKKAWGTDLVLAYTASTYSLLQDEKKALMWIEPVKLLKAETPSNNIYYSSFLRDVRILDLFSRHFPSKAKQVKASELASMFRNLDRSVNTLGAAYALMALSSYEMHFQKQSIKGFKLSEFGEKDKLLSQKDFDLKKRTKEVILFSSETKKMMIENPNKSLLFYAFTHSGFDKGAAKSKSDGLEVFKEILGADGKPTLSVKQGEEVTVVIKFRSTKDKGYSDMAITDLYPSGFASILSDEGRARGESGYDPDFIDTREDRIVSYGAIDKELQELRYKLKATNIGEFALPATLVQDMYHRENQAIGEQKVIKVVKP